MTSDSNAGCSGNSCACQMAADVKAAFSLGDMSVFNFPVILASSLAPRRRLPQSRCCCLCASLGLKGSENGTNDLISNVVLSADCSSSRATHRLAISSLHDNAY